MPGRAAILAGRTSAADTRKDLSYLGLATVTATDVATVARANVMEPDDAAAPGHLATLARTSPQRDRELPEFVGGVEETAAYLGGVEPWIPDLVDPNTCTRLADVQHRLLDPEHQPVPEEIVLLDVGDVRLEANGRSDTLDLVLVPDLPPVSAGISYVHEPTLVGLGQPRPDGTFAATLRLEGPAEIPMSPTALEVQLPRPLNMTLAVDAPTEQLRMRWTSFDGEPLEMRFEYQDRGGGTEQLVCVVEDTGEATLHLGSLETLGLPLDAQVTMKASRTVSSRYEVGVFEALVVRSIRASVARVEALLP